MSANTMPEGIGLPTFTSAHRWFTPRIDPADEAYWAGCGCGFAYSREDGRIVLLATGEGEDDLDEALYSDEWAPVETVEAGIVEVRRADCGAGCRCAAEVRPVPAPQAPTSDDPGVEYVRLVRAALTALTDARLYREKHLPDPYRSVYRDVWTLDTLDWLNEDEGGWWPTCDAETALLAIVTAGTVTESLVVDGAHEWLDDEVETALEVAGLLARDTDEVCGTCGKRWPEGTGEVIECERVGCPGTCPDCQDSPCPWATEVTP